MITAGIDVGIKNIKAVLLEDGKILAMDSEPSGGADRPESVARVWGRLLNAAGIGEEAVGKVVSTGIGKYDVPFAGKHMVEAVADAIAARFLYADAETVVDIGANQTLVVTLEDADKISEVAINQKCAACVGLFCERLADRLEMTMEEFSRADAEHEESVKVSDGCRVFAELDALDLLNRGKTPGQVAAAAVNAMAVRINSVLNDKVLPSRTKTVLIGGVTKNSALVRALEKQSGIRFLIPENAEYCCALGAALKAAQ